MKVMRTNHGRVPLRSSYLLARAEQAFTPIQYGTATDREMWLAQRLVHWMNLYAYRLREAGYEWGYPRG